MADVWSQASDNTFLKVSIENENKDASTENTHTRIYKYSDFTILLDEMSMPLDGNGEGGIGGGGAYDPSTGSYTDSSVNANVNKDYIDTTGTNGHNRSMTIGSLYPLIRINDRYFNHNDIKFFLLSTVGFLPTILLELLSVSNDLSKSEQIKDGDKVSVFINMGHGMIKSYRGDFIITSVLQGKSSTVDRLNTKKYYIYGELFIPNLYNSNMTFSFIGSSRDALIDASEKLGLGFFFCDEENTEDTQVWYCTSDGKLKSTGIPPLQTYIQNVASHAYKNFNSFFDCWIDPRYGLTFVNINKMLGENGLDEPIDLAFFNNVNTVSRGLAGLNSEYTDEEKKNNPRAQAKIFTNIGADLDSATAFFVTSFEEINAGSDITSALGLKNNNYYDIQNSGLAPEEASVEMLYSMPLNHEKLHNGFYALLGPGQNLYYKEGDNGSYVELHTTVQGGKISDTLSDDDAETMVNSGSNMFASGNTNKFFEVGYNHNLLNNMLLQKKLVKVTLNGCNLQIMRGEKIPMLILDDTFGANLAGIDGANAVSKRVYETYSGWFIIAGIKWTYNGVATPALGTHWETEVTLTRREWPIPGYVKNEMNPAETIIQTENNPSEGTTKDSISNTVNTNTTPDGSTAQNNEDTTTQGLTQQLVLIYQDIKTAAQDKNKDVKLIAGRRWAADENNNKVEGEPTIKDGNTWKFINTSGDIVWYSSRTSAHLYGNAFDIINSQGTSFNDILEIVINSPLTLADMLDAGVYMGVETSKDDTGNTVKHWHIGKPDLNDDTQVKGQNTWWAQVKKYLKTNTITYNGRTLNLSAYLQYSK